MHHTVSGLLGIKPRFILELHLNHHFEGVILHPQRTKNVLENVKNCTWKPSDAFPTRKLGYNFDTKSPHGWAPKTSTALKETWCTEERISDLTPPHSSLMTTPDDNWTDVLALQTWEGIYHITFIFTMYAAILLWSSGSQTVVCVH